jgi:hypothetical protein
MENGRLIINFSLEPSDVMQYLSGIPADELTRAEIFDFRLITPRETTARVLYPSDFDTDNSIHKAAIDDYIREMGQLSRLGPSSGKNIRSIRFQDLSLYWLTPMSQKNPQDSVLKSLHYFKFLSRHLRFENREILVVLPSTELHFQGTVLKYLVAKGARQECVRFNSPVKTKFSLRILLSYLRVFRRKINTAKKTMPVVESNGERIDDLILTCYPETWKGDERGDRVLGGIERLASEHGRKVKYLPFFLDLASLNELHNSQKFDQRFFHCFPTRMQIFRYYLSLIRCYIAIKRLKLSYHDFSFVDRHSVTHELMEVLHHKMEFFCNYLWLRNYFSGGRNIGNFYYQDEFYNTGRLISAAIEASRFRPDTYYGVQHGLFYEAHTVYILTDDELCPLGKYPGLPTPSKFIVWGEYFRELFLSYNTLPRNYAISAGNIDYIIRRRAVPESAWLANPASPTMLWCLTLKADLVNIYNTVVKDFVALHPEVRVVIRVHPLYDIRSFILNELIVPGTEGSFCFSEHSSVFDAIREADIVLTNSASTVFLDSLIVKKIVVEFVNPNYYMGSLAADMTFKVCNLADMNAFYKGYRSGNLRPAEVERLLELEERKWKQIFSLAA